jgi:hypothetical protein
MSHKQIRYSVPFAFAVFSFAVLMSVISIFGAVYRNSPPSQVKESPMPQRPALLIDDFSNPDRMSALGTFWRAFTDQVMGGVSTATSRMETMEGRRALRLVGDVSLENNGGFVQSALPLTGSGAPLDLSTYRGIRLTVKGNGETYHIHLRTTGTALPWQYYHAAFLAKPAWATIDIPFDGFKAAALESKLDPTQLTQIGVVASGKAFRADIAVARIEFYR